MEGKRSIAMDEWTIGLRWRDLATAEACGVPPDFWLIADTHFGDPDIDGYTGRPDDAEARIVARWRALVADDDADDEGSRQWPPSR